MKVQKNLKENSRSENGNQPLLERAALIVTTGSLSESMKESIRERVRHEGLPVQSAIDIDLGNALEKRPDEILKASSKLMRTTAASLSLPKLDKC